MAYNDSQDKDIERILRDHFASESEDLRAPTDPWEKLEGQMEDQPRKGGFMNWFFHTRRST